MEGLRSRKEAPCLYDKQTDSAIDLTQIHSLSLWYSRAANTEMLVTLIPETQVYASVIPSPKA